MSFVWQVFGDFSCSHSYAYYQIRLFSLIRYCLSANKMVKFDTLFTAELNSVGIRHWNSKLSAKTQKSFISEISLMFLDMRLI